jgi:hypothetical protein
MDKRGDIGSHTPRPAASDKQASLEDRADHVLTRLSSAAEKRASGATPSVPDRPETDRQN